MNVTVRGKPVTRVSQQLAPTYALTKRVTPADMRALLIVAGALVAAALPALLLQDAVRAAAALYPLSGPNSPWIPDVARVALLIAAPLAVFGTIPLLLGPGLMLALALNRAGTVAEWILHGFALSLVFVSVVAAATQSMLGAPLIGDRFILVVAVCFVTALGVALLRVRSGAQIGLPFAQPHAAHTLAGMAVVPILLLIGLAPKFYWEAFNGDGAHAFESGRLLLYQAVPFFDAMSGDIAGFPGTTSFLFAYPMSWFIRLFGELEVSARLPLLLFLVPLVASLLAAIEAGRAQVPGAVERWLIWLAVVSYVIVVAFSTTYSPYSADIALPATQDTLLVIGFVGFSIAFLERRWGWAVLWAFVTYTSLPNGLLLLAFWLAAWWLVQRPRPWSEVGRGGVAVAVAVLIVALVPTIVAALGGTRPGGEYGAAGLLTRFAFLQLTDWRRLAFVIVPAGILPALSLVLWRRQDRVARTFTLVTAAYFLFVFVQAHAPLHYYIPAMLLPLIVYWRMDPGAEPRRVIMLAATASATIVAIFLSWPSEAGPYVAARDIGRNIEFRVPGYEVAAPDPLRASTLLHHVVPYDWDPVVPHSSIGGSPLVFQYYAHSEPLRAQRNYVLQRATDAAPPGAQRVVVEDGFAVYVRDTQAWHRDLATRPATPAGAKLFQQPRSILFRSVEHKGSPTIIDLPAIAKRMGVDVDAVARKLGGKR